MLIQALLLRVAAVEAQTFTTLHSFSAAAAPDYTNTVGTRPSAGVVVADGVIYGTTYRGGLGSGAVFKGNIDGTGFTNLHRFAATSSSLGYSNIDGTELQCHLTLSGDMLYGTAPYGGDEGRGTVFTLGTNGAGFKVLHNFTLPAYPHQTNSDGAMPFGNLVMANGTLLGVIKSGMGEMKLPANKMYKFSQFVN